jgi:hypothetical protein
VHAYARRSPVRGQTFTASTAALEAHGGAQHERAAPSSSCALHFGSTSFISTQCMNANIARSSIISCVIIIKMRRKPHPRTSTADHAREQNAMFPTHTAPVSEPARNVPGNRRHALFHALRAACGHARKASAVIACMPDSGCMMNLAAQRAGPGKTPAPVRPPSGHQHALLGMCAVGTPAWAHADSGTGICGQSAARRQVAPAAVLVET